MWIRIGHFVRAWSKLLSRSRTDNWAAQAKAERGSGWASLSPRSSSLWSPSPPWGVGVGPRFTPPGVQSAVLSLGWPVLGVVTILQTFFMLRRLVRRRHGLRA